MGNQSWDLLPEHVRAGRTWSYSTLHMVESCPFKYKCSKIDRLPSVPSRALLMGNVFDTYCNGGDMPIVDTGLTADEVAMIALKYIEYRNAYILPTDQLQVPMWRRLSDEAYLVGFADRVRDDLIVDHKFCETPLKDNKPKSGWPEQARCYLWMAGIHDRPYRFEFHVLNATDEQIQIVPYKPRSGSVAGVPGWAMGLIAKIESGQFDPIMGYYCYDEKNKPPRWKCDYYEVCPLMDAKNDIDSGLEANDDAICESE